MSWIWLVLFALVTFVVYKYKTASQKGTPLPPGPPADPLIGHLRSIPFKGQDMYFYELGIKYGGVVHLKIPGQSLVILNSVQAAVDLLDKRGSSYSDRPHLPVYDLLGLSNSTVLQRYGPEWRAHRTILQRYFSKEVRKTYRPVQIREARILAQNLVSNNEDRLGLFLQYTTGTILNIAYGHQVKSSDDPYLKIASECSRLIAESGQPGATPIDVFPFLRHFPSWFPGTYYATFARNAVPTVLMLFTYPYDEMKEKMAKGLTKPSILASMLEDLHNEGKEDEIKVKRIQALSASIYFAGAETTSSTLAFFLLAMVLYPEYQIKAQEQIDTVVGINRLPEFEDRDNLPFIDCILQETLRWHQAVPTGVPHKLMEDDVYNGMLIPKGSLIVANARGMTLDGAVYKDPFKFDPTRFLPSPEGRGEPYPTGHFGFGRRICPGRHLAEDSVWVAIAIILATTTISKVIGEDGNEIVPEENIVITGPTSHPSPFPCHLQPRSETSIQLLQRAIESD